MDPCRLARALAEDVLRAAGKSGAEVLVDTGEGRRCPGPRGGRTACGAGRPLGEWLAENLGAGCTPAGRPPEARGAGHRGCGRLAARLAELWVAAKVVEAVEGETLPEGCRGRREARCWLFGRGRMALVRSPSGREYAVLLESAWDGYGNPDVAVYERRAAGRLWLRAAELLAEGLGTGLSRFFEEFGWPDEDWRRPMLIVEVKLGVSDPDRAAGQLARYVERLAPRRAALAALKPAPDAARRLRGVEIFDGLLDPDMQGRFTEYVKAALGEL